MTIREWQEIVFANNKAHGFHEGENATNIDRKLMLAVGELSEAQEELRAGHAPTEVYHADPYPYSHPTKPEGFGMELVDAVIRIMDICACTGVDLESCIEEKHAYNVTRPYLHGKVF